MDKATIEFLAVFVPSTLNILLLIYQTVKRVPQEVRKIEAERYESITEAAESNMQGAQISNDLLMTRLREMRRELRDERNYNAILKRKMIEANMHVPPFVPTESEPKIKAINKE